MYIKYIVYTCIYLYIVYMYIEILCQGTEIRQTISEY